MLYCIFVCISGEVNFLGDLHVRVQQFVFVLEGGSRSSAAVELPENLDNMVPSVASMFIMSSAHLTVTRWYGPSSKVSVPSAFSR